MHYVYSMFPRMIEIRINLLCYRFWLLSNNPNMS
nr:MAG TPA: hypothetical protein [Caudoviricetes sp.]